MAFGAVLLAAVVVRGWGLGARSLWFDEAYSFSIARQPLLEIPRLLLGYDTHPPLYYVFLHVWMALLGKSEVALRVPSVVAGVGVVVLTFLLARRLAGDRVGLLAAALIAFSPFQITAAQDARMYSLLTSFGLGASYALWLGLEGGRRAHWAAYAVFMLLALYIHHLALLLVLTHGTYVLAVYRTKAARRTWTLWMGAVLMAYLPVLPLLYTQFITARFWPSFRPSFGVGALTDMVGLFSFGGGLFGMGTYFRRGVLPLEQRAAVLLPFLLLAICGVAGLAGWRKRTYLLGYWLLPIITVAGISLKWNMFYERYFSFVLPPFMILLAAGVFYLADAMRGRAKTVAVVALLIFLASFNLPALADVYRVKHPYDWRAAAHYVTAKARADDFVIFIPGFARMPFEYYFEGRQARMVLNPDVLAGNRTADLKTLIGKLDRISHRHPRMWIVATIPVGYETRLRIEKFLAPYFREVEGEGRDFGLVYAFVWESRLYADRPAKPVKTAR